MFFDSVKEHNKSIGTIRLIADVAGKTKVLLEWVNAVKRTHL